jgi:uncharacterized protein with NAD-binding domain and iron-sulfur cluster
MTRVAIFGAGVGGLTAAHELIRRGYDVDVYERLDLCGGKSRSHFPADVPPPTGSRDPLPGEHGFRFFPCFYRHLIDVLQDIPSDGDPVSSDLVRTPEAGLAFKNEGLVSFPRDFGGNQSAADIFSTITRLYSDLDFTNEDLKRMAWFRLKYLTSGAKRRKEQYENMPWTEFVESDSVRYSERFREFDKAIPRTMSALVAEKTSAKVIGDISMQFLLGLGRPWQPPDRLLRGPSSEIWIDKWRDRLINLGVTISLNHELEEIQLDGGNRIQRCRVKSGANVINVVADHYVFALPINDFRSLINPEMRLLDPDLGTIADVPSDQLDGWMVGAQVYLRDDFPMVAGHMFYPDSEWAVTSISQAQFWGQKGGPIEDRYGDGSVTGILSIIISDWETPSDNTGLSARATLQQANGAHAVVVEALSQIHQGVNDPRLEHGNAQACYLDEGVKVVDGVAENSTPLLLHPVGGFADRPNAYSETIDNLYLASDYVATFTQLASMESACEAAKRAVNMMLVRDASPHYPCDVVDLQEELLFEPAKRLDDIRFDKGRPHIMDTFPFRLLLDVPVLSPIMQIVLNEPFELLENL